MSEYRRYYQSGGYYFFTLVTYQRRSILTIPENIVRLKAAIQHTKQKHPFQVTAIVILPDHLHCMWKLYDGDDDFSMRVRLIKRYFSMYFPTEKNHRSEKRIWQRRFWEHFIRDEKDWQRHMDYIHYNPVKHGYANSVDSWPYSSFHYWVKKNLYEKSWGSFVSEEIAKMDFE